MEGVKKLPDNSKDEFIKFLIKDIEDEEEIEKLKAENEALIAMVNDLAEANQKCDAIIGGLKSRNNDWQPIETAPRDGSEFIAYDKYDGIFTARNIDGELYSSWQGGMVIDSQTNFDTIYKSPSVVTHWQPLPKPPTNKE